MIKIFRRSVRIKIIDDARESGEWNDSRWERLGVVD